MKRLLRGMGSDGRLRTLRIRPGSTCGLACLVTVLCLTASAQSQSNPGTYEVLHTFNSTPNGGTPASALLRDAQGSLYGTTSSGGNSSAACSNNYCGVVFKIDSAGNEAVLYSFNGQPDGSNPQAGLIQDAAGNLYGTTCGGGATDNGTIFKVDNSGKETVLYSFSGQQDGSCPAADLVTDTAGNIYGTTTNGGVSNAGTIFKFDSTGKETVLYSFTGQSDGKNPQGLLRDSAGNLYGIANRGGIVNCTGSRGGATGCGTIFKLDTTATFTVLYSFHGSNPTHDGGLPVGALVADAAGNLYGETYYGGSGGCIASFPGGKSATVGCGTVFRLDTSAIETVLHSFVQTDGSYPQAGLTIDSSGNQYGTTSSNIFEFDTSGNLTVLYDFTGGNDGSNPRAPLFRDSAGNLYGTASSSSGHCPDACGVVFELPATTSPVFNVEITFTGSGTGTVTSNPGGINCPPNCVSAFPVGTTVTLTASPTGGSTFGSWQGTLPGSPSGCTTTNANICTVNSTQVLDAVFSPPPPDFTISASTLAPASVNPGNIATSTITTTATGGFNGSITLSCTVQSSVPFAPTCSVSPTSVNAGTSSKVTVNTTGPSAAMVKPFDSGLLYGTCLPVLGLLVAGPALVGRNRKLKVRLATLCLLVAGALFQVACGSSRKIGSGGTPAGSYTVIVTGVSGSLQHSVNPNLTLTVQ